MTKKEAIDLLDNLIGMIEDNHGSDYDSAIRMAIDALESKWIPCSKELPKNGTSVLFCDDEGDIYNGYCLVRDGGRYHMWMEYHNADRIKNVVAWMPLPNPWKEGQDETN